MKLWATTCRPAGYKTKSIRGVSLLSRGDQYKLNLWRYSMEMPVNDMQIFRIFLLIFVLFALTATAESFKDEKYYEQDMMSQIPNWLTQAVRNRDHALCSISASKRNSEIINSILGLPKNLNDVGKK